MNTPKLNIFSFKKKKLVYVNVSALLNLLRSVNL